MPKKAFFVKAVTAIATIPVTGLSEPTTDIIFGTIVKENPIINKNPQIDSAGTNLLNLFITPHINKAPLIAIIKTPASNGQCVDAVPEIIVSHGMPPNITEGMSANELIKVIASKLG